MLDPTPIRFQKLRVADLRLLWAWLNKEIVTEWYGKRNRSYEEVVAKYGPRIAGEVPTSSFLIMYGDMPIGYIQTYKIRDYPDYSRYVQVDEDCAGIDLFIGEEAYIHKGLGSFILTRFLREVVFGTMGARSCIIGPEPKNKIAIRAYEKAGFRYLKTVQLPDEAEPEYLMRIERGQKQCYNWLQAALATGDTMDYEVTIGLEIHAQILTDSKMFCGCSADSTNAEPNTHVCPVCLGLPGALPVINRRAVELAALTGLALNCRIQNDNVISRKNYFYPDLPSSYQRTQYDDPLCVEGWVEIAGDAGARRVGLTRVHIEEDTGKRMHLADGSTLVDFNRSGVPLMEIVSEPEIASPEEARRYFQKLRQVLIWIGVNTGNMEEGALRCDANISVRPRGQEQYGAKVEIKNMNSFRAVERALAYEIERQIAALEAGQAIRQATRGWNEALGKTVEQRSKESAHDYRYFPEPDLPPLQLTPEWIAERRAALPELPDARRARFVADYGLSPYDAETLTIDRGVADYYERAVAAARDIGATPKEVANWSAGELFRLLKETGEDLASAEARFRPEYIAEVLDLLGKGTITRTTAKEAFEASFRTGQPPARIVAERGWAVIDAGDALAALAREIVAANPKVAADYRSGKATAIKFLVGQVMKATRGQANPQAAQAALEHELGSEEAT